MEKNPEKDYSVQQWTKEELEELARKVVDEHYKNIADECTGYLLQFTIEDGTMTVTFPFHATFDRILTPEEIQSLQDNPWQMFEAKEE